MYTIHENATSSEILTEILYQLKKLSKARAFLLSFFLSNWSAPKANEHDRMPPAPIAIRAKEESNTKSWGVVGFSHVLVNSSQGGLACGMTAVNHNKIVPYYIITQKDSAIMILLNRESFLIYRKILK